jgi:peptidoglycan/xylan/chitin deacetylase (PgdA/CDA1 family)
MTDRVLLHSVGGAPGSPLARWLDRASAPYGELRPLIGPFPRPIVRITGPEALLDEAAESLPEGAARPEAIAVRLRRAGVELSWGKPDSLPDAASFVRLCRVRGASSVELVRTDPSLLTEMQVGSFFHAYWRRRVLRHAVLRLRITRAFTLFPTLLFNLASDLAFWEGVRSSATSQEWERLARSSYVVFYYHRIGRGGWPGQEHLDLDVRRFERQLRLLRLLGFRALSPGQLLAFHADPGATLSPRSYVLTVDDALRDAVVALDRHATLYPQVFVNTSGVGRTPPWGFGKAVANWEELKAFEAAGGVIGSHCRNHPRLPTLDSENLRDELTGSLSEIQSRFPEAPPLLAYPHGHHDERVRSMAEAAGYRAAFTTAPGRNGAGIDAYCLRRIGPKDWDGYAAFLWKALTGEWLPRRWGQLARLRKSPGTQGSRLALPHEPVE